MTEKNYMTNDRESSAHLTKAVLKKSLEKGIGTSNINITDVKISRGSNPGDNYTSTIFRVIVTYDDPKSTKNTVHLIVKSIVITENMEFFLDMGLADREIQVYNDLLPKFNKILSPSKVSPRCYDIFTEPHRNFIFEDMKASGYCTADREVGLDGDHLKVVLGKIAQFHAASMKLLQQEPELKQKYSEGIFTPYSVNHAAMQTAFKENIKLGAELLSQMPKYERFSEKLMKIYDNFVEIALDCVRPIDGHDVNVLNHGDLWLNNFLFKYEGDSSKPVDAVFVDYQITNYNSLGIDLNYLFATSAQLEFFKQKLELIEKYYYPVFANLLKKLRISPIPSFEDITKQIRQREIYSLICMFGVLPLVTMNKEDSKTNSMDQFFDEEVAAKKRQIGMAGERFVETMKYMVVDLEWKINEVICKY